MQHGGSVKLPIRCLTCPTKSLRIFVLMLTLSAREKLFKGEVFHIDHLISPEQLVIEYMRRLIEYPVRCRWLTLPVVVWGWSP